MTQTTNASNGHAGNAIAGPSAGGKKPSSPFVQFLRPDVWVWDELGFLPDEWQQQFLMCQKNLHARTSRQAGKSTICAAKVLHTAVMRPGTRSAICAPTLRQSQLLSSTISDMMKKMHTPPKMANDAQSLMRFENGSVIYSLPGSDAASLRGYSIDGVLVIDEAAFFNEEAWVAVGPFVAVGGGQIITTSTPNGPLGWWYELWQQQPQSWEFINVPATSVPRISAEFLERERLRMTRNAYEMEYMCEWGSTSSSLWSTEDIEAMFDCE